MGGWSSDSTGPLQRTVAAIKAGDCIYIFSRSVTAVDAGNFPRDFLGRNELDYTHSLIGGETWSSGRLGDVSQAAF